VPIFFLYSLAIFVNAALLFLIEPMIAKMILPLLGGTPNVWNTSMFFFQAMLVAGYAYAHFASRWMGLRLHAILHLLLVVSCVAALPVSINSSLVSAEHPAMTIILLLLGSIGLPFFVLAAGTPLLQRWFAAINPAADPYPLYAASNLGSMIGLVAYPVLVEPSLALSEQTRFWLDGYLLYAFVAFTCGAFLVQRVPAGLRNASADGEGVAGEEQEQVVITGWLRLRWVELSFVPSSILLGVTTYTTTDIASAPLLWMIPLVLYLLSFVIAFSRPDLACNRFIVRRQAFLLLGTAITIFMRANSPIWIILPLHLLSFFVTALVCHGLLSKGRPAPHHLTEFYLWIAIGGMLGGVFNALLAPVLFKHVYEYPIGIIAAALLRPSTSKNSEPSFKRQDWLLPVAVGVLLIALTRLFNVAAFIPARSAYIATFGAVAILCLSFASRPLRFALGLTAFFVASTYHVSSLENVIFSDRSFFGVYRTVEQGTDRVHVLFHGTTIHGAENFGPGAVLQPTSYYHPNGPAGQVFKALQADKSPGKVAVVGLGSGAMACYGRPGDTFTFYEIDPLVERIARDPRLFTYMRDCLPNTEVVIGDARLSLARAPANRYDVIVLDAFSSDAIPVHLLTREALKLYLSKLTDSGLLLFHISNRFLSLGPVLGRIAQSMNLTGLEQRDFRGTAKEIDESKSPSHWVVLARRTENLAGLSPDARWKSLEMNRALDLWTDQYSNLLRVMQWRQ
jgi:spermidine synthase